MLRNNKRQIFITSLFILAPMLLGLALWNTLPAQIPTHFGFGGEVNGWSSRAFAVFGIPLFVLGCHLICVFATAADPKNRGRNGKIQTLVLWICPAVSWFVAGLIYVSVLGWRLDTDRVGLLFLGVLFLVLGNYLPKCQRNSTVGIKLPWTLWDEENWNATHRFAGKLWVIGGVLMMACAWLLTSLLPWALTALLLPLAFAPCVYSYWLWRKK